MRKLAWIAGLFFVLGTGVGCKKKGDSPAKGKKPAAAKKGKKAAATKKAPKGKQAVAEKKATPAAADAAGGPSKLAFTFSIRAPGKIIDKSLDLARAVQAGSASDARAFVRDGDAKRQDAPRAASRLRFGWQRLGGLDGRRR
jgi:hypothetical protein